ncbi:hypothetical protein [Salinactinospora qingdaonensis]|uniref:Uncharacterized protein n=1 Tax=Salinactinospora qingdaonensis TaxID=702744 RepID=A0ABP7FBA0_9ACTN
MPLIHGKKPDQYFPLAVGRRIPHLYREELVQVAELVYEGCDGDLTTESHDAKRTIGKAPEDFTAFREQENAPEQLKGLTVTGQRDDTKIVMTVDPRERDTGDPGHQSRREGPRNRNADRTALPTALPLEPSPQTRWTTAIPRHILHDLGSIHPLGDGRKLR